MMSLKFQMILFVSLIIILLFNLGCTRTVYVYPPTPKCLITQRPTLKYLNPEDTDIQIMKDLLLNLNKCVSYSYELESSLKCYQLYFDELENVKKEENKK